MRKAYLVPVAAALALLVAPSSASAKGVNFVLQLDPLGLASGWRVEGTEFKLGESDFFNRNQGGAIGFKSGFELEWFEIYFDLHGGYSDVGFKETWMAGMAGFRNDFRLAPRSMGFAWIAVDGGYGFGTEGPVRETSLDVNLSPRIQQKGVVGVLRLGTDYYMSRYVSVGLEIDVGYHYLWLDGPAVIGIEDSHVQGVHVIGVMDFRFLLGTGNTKIRPARVPVLAPTYQPPAYQPQPYRPPPPPEEPEEEE